MEPTENVYYNVKEAEANENEPETSTTEPDKLEFISLESSADAFTLKQQLEPNTLSPTEETHEINQETSQNEAEQSNEPPINLPDAPNIIFHEPKRVLGIRMMSEMSPMMKSVADITEALEEAKYADPDDPNDENAVLKSFDETDRVEITSQELSPNLPNTDTHSSLQKFFDNDNYGSDIVGKAFFDTISSPAIETNVTSPKSSVDSFFSHLDDKESFHDAWIPSKQTQDALISIVTSPSSFLPNKSQLTMPGIIIEDVLLDPIKVLLNDVKFNEVITRQVLTENDVTQDDKGLQQLIASKCYNAAINLTTRLITALGQGPGKGGHQSQHSPNSLQLWFTRISLFAKMQKFPFAEVESEAFDDLDKPDMYYEYYGDVYPGKKGSMVPFSFRVLLAELPQHQGNYHKALDRLYSLQTVTNKILENLSNNLAEDGSMIERNETQIKESMKLWQSREIRILYSILNCMLAQKDYVMAINMTKNLIEKDCSKTSQLYSALGKIYLQLGDVLSADDCFNKSIKERVQDVGTKSKVQDLINKALMCIAQNGYTDAYSFFNEAYILDSTNAALANNMAVCLLYMGKLKEALNSLERVVMSDPRQCLHEGAMFNLCTLYELQSVNCTAKKDAMLKLAALNTGDSFQTNCLKIDAANR